MANHFGYNQQFTDKPEMWDVDGYAVCTDGYGTLVLQINAIQPNGSLLATQLTSGSNVIKDITQSANNSGIYKIHLTQSWNQLTHASLETVIPTGQSVPMLRCQHMSDTVGNSSFGPGQTELQYIQFQTVVPSTGSNGSLDQGSGFRFRLRLKRSSA
jgi:hypothetical protein